MHRIGACGGVRIACTGGVVLGGVGGLAYFVGEPGSDEVGDGDDPGAVVFFLSVGEVAALASADDGGFVDVAELGCSGHGE